MMATEVKAPSEDDAIVSIVQSCLYPELSVDCGTEAPDCTLNSAFRDQLRERLYRLFNCLRPFGLHPLSLNDRVHLTILYCEQTAKLADFRTDAVDLVKEVTALGQLIDQWLLVDERRELNELVLHWYKERVTVARWRRQVGATHGLARYAVIGFVHRSLSIDDALFLLAAGSLTMEHFDRTYKELALDMFTVVLWRISASDLQSTNIAAPIFRLCLQQVSQLKGLPIQRLLWSCLCRCLNTSPTTPAAAVRWSDRDEAGSALLTRLAFENNATVRRYLMQCIPRVFAPDIGTTDDDDDEAVMLIDLAVFRERCLLAGICLTACRWTKKLAKILPYHVSCCFGPATDVAYHLRCVHIVYLVTLYAMPLALCTHALRELLDTLPTHLLQLLQYHTSKCDGDRQAAVRSEVYELLHSLLQQLERPSGNVADETADAVLSADVRAFFSGRAKTIAVILLKIQHI